MTSDELRAAGRELYGSYGWQRKLATELGVEDRTVRRWVSEEVPVPGPVEAAINCFLREKRSGNA